VLSSSTKAICNSDKFNSSACGKLRVRLKRHGELSLIVLQPRIYTPVYGLIQHVAVTAERRAFVPGQYVAKGPHFGLSISSIHETVYISRKSFDRWHSNVGCTYKTSRICDSIN